MPNHIPKNILIAPLDWGAGHTTRCIPIIRYLLEMGHRVFLAGNDWQRSLAAAEVQGAVTFLPLEGYNITYSPLNRFMQLGLLLQSPSFLATIRREQQWLLQVVKDHAIDGIISDNRYGLYHASVPSVILTHQLHVLSGMGRMADNVIQRLHYRWLSRFGEVWVPDVQGSASLAGDLSQPAYLPPGTHYIGLLSRFAPPQDTAVAEAGRLLILLSGPEPQRTLLSQLLWSQVAAHKASVVFAEGSTNALQPPQVPPHVQWHTRITGSQLAAELHHADWVICRSGYSTLMDLAALGKRAILIPTPGQTEQEYLGRRAVQQSWHYSSAQAGFSLHTALEKATARSLSPGLPVTQFNMYKAEVSRWLSSL